jgi:hypothetical protein
MYRKCRIPSLSKSVFLIVYYRTLRGCQVINIIWSSNLWTRGVKLLLYKEKSKIFRTNAVKTIKLTIKPIGRYHPRIISLSHVDTGPTVSSIFWKLPGSTFVSECQTFYAIRPGSPQCYQTAILSFSISFLEIRRIHRVTNQGSTVVGGWQLFCISPENTRW